MSSGATRVSVESLLSSSSPADRGDSSGVLAIDDHDDRTSPVRVSARVDNTSELCWFCDASTSKSRHFVLGLNGWFRSPSYQAATAERLSRVEEHAISLCPRCRPYADDHLEPGFAILPTKLQYFVTFEEHDYKRRLRVLQATHIWTRRQVPTSLDYEQHLAANGFLTGEIGQGGLYDRYVLNVDMPRLCSPSQFRPGKWTLGGPKHWSGQPIAAITRAINFLKILERPWTTRGVEEELLQLRTLYERDLPEVPRQTPQMVGRILLPQKSQNDGTVNSRPFSGPSELPSLAQYFPVANASSGTVESSSVTCQSSPLISQQSFDTVSFESDVRYNNGLTSPTNYSPHIRNTYSDPTLQSGDLVPGRDELMTDEAPLQHQNHGYGWNNKRRALEDEMAWGPCSTSSDKIMHREKRRRAWEL